MEDRIISQERHLEWASVWTAKFDDFLTNSERKTMILEVSGPGGQDQFAEKTPRVGLSMDSKM